MDREQMIKAMAQALADRDEYIRIAEDARNKADEAQAAAWELQLKLFEMPGRSIDAAPVDTEEGAEPSTIERVLWSFKVPRTVPDVMQVLNLRRGQVQAALTALLEQRKVRRKSRGVYVAVKGGK